MKFLLLPRPESTPLRIAARYAKDGKAIEVYSTVLWQALTDKQAEPGTFLRWLKNKIRQWRSR